MNKEILNLVNDCEKLCKDEFSKIDEICFKNTSKVIEAFHEEELCENDFNQTTGYGYDDIGREKIEKIFARVLNFDDALVRNQFVSGSHALNVTFLLF